MKKKLIVLVLFIVAISLIAHCALQTRQDKVLNSLGKYENEQFWTHGEFQDYTDFGVYSYSSAKLENNRYFKKITESDSGILYGFVDDFEKCINVYKNNDPNDELVSNYAFDRSVIDAGDYFYIYEKENHKKYGCYDIWIFDVQTNTLYYFHNNT